MQTASFLLILAGVIMVGAVFVLRLRRPPNLDHSAPAPHERQDPLGLEGAWVPGVGVKTARMSLDEVDLAAELVDIERKRIEADAEFDSPPPREVAAPRDYAPRAPQSRPEPPRARSGPIVLHVIAAEEGCFNGPAILEAMRTIGMGHGDMNIFHYYAAGRPSAPPLFSAANMLNPGEFDLEHMDRFQTRGLALFMLPQSADDEAGALEIMLDAAGRLAEMLGGEVRDERRQPITAQALERMRAGVAPAVGARPS